MIVSGVYHRPRAVFDQHRILMTEGNVFAGLSAFTRFSGIMISLVLLACASREPIAVPEIEDAEPVIPIRHILVMPFFDMAEAYGPETGVRGPFSDQIFVTGETDPLVTDFLTHDLIEQLRRQYPDLRITVSGLPALGGAGQELQRLSALRQAGRQRSADAVLVGFIYDYQEREGGAFGVRSPARAAFELNLIGVDSGRLLWQRQFQEVQKALHENLLLLPKFLRRGGRWVPVREMANEGMRQMLKTIPQND